MLAAFFRWLAALIGQKLLDFAYPEAAQERERLIEAKKVEDAKDVKTEAERVETEKEVVAREKKIDDDQVVVSENKKEIEAAKKDLGDKLKRIDEATTIEDVLKIK